MVDRVIVYAGAIPLETDILHTNKNAMVSIGALAASLFGATTSVNGLAVTPTAPATMQVVVGAGEIYARQNIDDSAYSSLASDTAHQTVKQGVVLDPVLLSCAAPATTGYSTNYLIQAAFSEVDSASTVLPYYNSSDPTQAFSGPAGSGAAQPTMRSGTVILSAKPGVAAPSGSQVTPTADSGYVGLAVVSVPAGATSITSANITALTAANFVPAGGILAALQVAVAYVARLQTTSTAQIYADNKTAGTYTITVPSWATRAEVGIIGGGGGGGGSATGYSGGGGGAGGYATGVVNVSPGATLTAVVGAGGTGITGSATAGTGGTSSLSGIGSATGGAGGSGGTSAPAGGAGGTATATGIRTFAGGNGGDGSPTGSQSPGGNGSGGPFGGQGRSGSGGGVAGAAPGAGGGGAWGGSGTGGAGAPGAVLIRWLP